MRAAKPEGVAIVAHSYGATTAASLWSGTPAVDVTGRAIEETAVMTERGPEFIVPRQEELLLIPS